MVSKKGTEPNEEILVVFSSERMRRLVRKISIFGAAEENILLTGETGVGKDVIAHLIHAFSLRKTAPFIPICAPSIPPDLIASELFGHEKGAFTGADKQKTGRFEQAHNGTLFLDEITEMPVKEQASILRALQDKKIQRVGGSKDIPADARLISATNRDPEQAIAEGRFRQDLYHRLGVIEILIPPLREHKEDIPDLIWLLKEQSIQNNKLKTKDLTFSQEAAEALLAYNWPGNIRELRNAIAYAVILTSQEEEKSIQPEHLPAKVLQGAAGQPAPEDRSLAQKIVNSTEPDYIFRLTPDGVICPTGWKEMSPPAAAPQPEDYSSLNFGETTIIASLQQQPTTPLFLQPHPSTLTREKAPLNGNPAPTSPDPSPSPPPPNKGKRPVKQSEELANSTELLVWMQKISQLDSIANRFIPGKCWKEICEKFLGGNRHAISLDLARTTNTLEKLSTYRSVMEGRSPPTPIKKELLAYGKTKFPAGSQEASDFEEAINLCEKIYGIHKATLFRKKQSRHFNELDEIWRGEIKTPPPRNAQELMPFLKEIADLPTNPTKKGLQLAFEEICRHFFQKNRNTLINELYPSVHNTKGLKRETIMNAFYGHKRITPIKEMLIELHKDCAKDRTQTDSLGEALELYETLYDKYKESRRESLVNRRLINSAQCENHYELIDWMDNLVKERPDHPIQTLSLCSQEICTQFFKISRSMLTKRLTGAHPGLAAGYLRKVLYGNAPMTEAVQSSLLGYYAAIRTPKSAKTVELQKTLEAYQGHYQRLSRPEPGPKPESPQAPQQLKAAATSLTAPPPNNTLKKGLEKEADAPKKQTSSGHFPLPTGLDQTSQLIIRPTPPPEPTPEEKTPDDPSLFLFKQLDKISKDFFGESILRIGQRMKRNYPSPLQNSFDPYVFGYAPIKMIIPYFLDLYSTLYQQDTSPTKNGNRSTFLQQALSNYGILFDALNSESPRNVAPSPRDTHPAP
ncbi:MAG: sigma-54 interaction domain-containing protein [Bdellovibrionales bacterium]